MPLSKKHFKAIADIIKTQCVDSHDILVCDSIGTGTIPPRMHKVTITQINKAEIVADFCDYFKGENPNFNEAKFKEACGL